MKFGDNMKITLIAMTLIVASFVTNAADTVPFVEPQVTIEQGVDYVFKPIAITPSPNGENYLGRFLFVNKGSSPMMVNGFGKPIHREFEPSFIKHQKLQDGVWKDIRVGYCGLGEEFAMKPGKPYEFHAGLWAFHEQGTPLTGRIGFDVSSGLEGGWVEYWSYPFVLDWKKDRESGEFASVNKEHYKKLRAAFTKAGFKEEFLVGDDFCSRLLQSIMKETLAQDAAKSFKPFVGKLNVTPSFELNGNIRIDFTSDEVRNFGTEYTGWFVLNPSKFSREWLQTARAKHVKVNHWGNGIQMALDDGTQWWTKDGTFYLCIKYVPFEKSTLPSLDNSREVFNGILDVMDGWLAE